MQQLRSSMISAWESHIILCLVSGAIMLLVTPQQFLILLIMASGSITSWQIEGETMETVRDFILGVPKSLQMVTAAMKLKDACSLEEKL